MINRIRQSLSLKLSLGILLLAAVVFTVSMGFQFQHSRRIIRQEAIERATSMLNTSQAKVARYLNEVETATNNIEWLVLKHMQPDSLLTYTHRIVEQNPNINGCSITTEPFFFQQYGKYFSAYSVRKGDTIETAREAEYDYFEKVWYKTPKMLGKACWVDPFNDYNEGTLSNPEIIVSYCKPLYNEEGRFIGVISTDMALDKLSEIISHEKPYPNSYFIVLGKEGHFFLHPDTTLLYSKNILADIDPREHPDIISLGFEMISGHQGSMHLTINHQPHIVCYQPQPHTDWSMALISPESDIFSSYRRMVNLVLPVVAIGLLLILLLCRRAVGYAIEPLTHLARQSKLIANGEFGEDIPTTNRKDAVGRLQNSFASMQQSLARYISNVQKANEESARRNEELEKANILVQKSAEQKTAFIQNMTHQIRTPLNIIMGFSQILRDSVSQLTEAEVETITGLIDRNTVTLSRMTAMLYDSSDSGTVGLSMDDIVACNEIVRESIENSQRQFPELLPIAFETTLPDSFCIRTNRLYLFRSIRELFYNAAKYSDGQHVSVRLYDTEKELHIVVEDIGPGIPLENHDLLYTPFSKTNDLSEGLGLGLPLTRRHVVNLGGTFHLDTTYHDGCRFIISLPKNITI